MRSKEIYKKAFEAPALQMAMDWSPEDFDKPQIIIESSWGYNHRSFHNSHLLTTSNNYNYPPTV
jgi:dihydroxyacid dehydratase/phosphogluconate dehydratase